MKSAPACLGIFLIMAWPALAQDVTKPSETISSLKAQIDQDRGQIAALQSVIASQASTIKDLNSALNGVISSHSQEAARK